MNVAEIKRKWAAGLRSRGPSLVELFRRSIAEHYKAKSSPGQKSLWDEDKHPREDDGKFGEGSGSGGAGEKPAAQAVKQASSPEEHIAEAGKIWKEKHVKSPHFKAWFGDWEGDPASASKVVDKDGKPQETHNIPGTSSKVMRAGKPLTVYHGTSRGGWKEFQKSKLEDADNLLWGPGFYFTEDSVIADQYRNKGGKEQDHKLKVTAGEAHETILNRATRFVDELKNTPDNGKWGKFGPIANKARQDKLQELIDAVQKAKTGGEENGISWEDGSNVKLLQDLGIATSDLIESKDASERKSAYLNIRKPFDIDWKINGPEFYEKMKSVDREQVRKNLASFKSKEWDQVEQDTVDFAIDECLSGSLKNTESTYGKHAYGVIEDGHGKAFANALLQAMGYDGITHVGGAIQGDREHQVWIAFEPTQIKSTDNRGTFDPKENRMDYARENNVKLFRAAIEKYRRQTEHYEQWVTIGAKDHRGGTPVQLDANGNIVKGPSTLAGQHVGSLRPKFPTPGDKGGDFKLEGGSAEPPAPKPKQGPLFDKTATAGKEGKDTGKPAKLPYGPSQLHPGDIKADPSRFQYKISGIDQATGVTKELKEVRKFNPMLAGQIMVWQDPDNGETYVVNGHHRHELATRTGYDKPLSVYHVEAKDAQEARAAGALANIAGGKGTAIDAAKFMRDSGRTVQDLADEGISLSGKIARDGAVLSKVSPKIFQDLANGLTTEDRALAIGKHVSKPEHQDQLYKILKAKEEKTDKNVPNNVVEEMAREMEMAGSRKSSGTDLFGDFEDEKSNFLERGELKAGIRKLLGEEKTAFKAVAKDKRASRLQAEGKNVLDTEGNKRRAQTAAEALGTFDKLVNTKGPLSDAINEAAIEYGNNPRSKKRILDELHGKIGGLLEQEWGGSKNDLQQGATETPGSSDSGTLGSGSELTHTESEYDGKKQYVFKSGGKEIGEIATVKRGDGNREVSNILIWPEHQRKGYGEKLYRHAYEDAKKQGEKLYISDDRTEDAKKLHDYFQSKGFLRPDGEIDFSGQIEKFSRRMKDQMLAYISQANREKYFRSMVSQVIRFARVEWKESDHPRANDGKFGSGGGSGKSQDAAADDQAAKPSADHEKWHAAMTAGEKKTVEDWGHFGWEDIRKAQTADKAPKLPQASREHKQIAHGPGYNPKKDPIPPAGQPLGEWAVRNSTKWTGKLDPTFISNGPSGGFLDSAYRDGGVTDQQREWHAKDMASYENRQAVNREWQQALAKAPIHKGEAFRGLLGVDPKKFKTGTEFTIDADSSASKAETVGARFATREAKSHSEPGEDGPQFDTGNGILLHVKSKTAADISSLGKPEEKEVILRKGTKYKVTQVSDGGSTEWGSYTRVEVEEI